MDRQFYEELLLRLFSKAILAFLVFGAVCLAIGFAISKWIF